ncbi:MAG: HD domain-containing protein [Desulfovibrio sp.]|nr:HD domain-containing protein [Desulfovibrio sp.]
MNRGDSISALIQREQPVDGVYALTGVQKRLDKKSNPYWDLVLKDRSGSVAAKIWMTRGRLVPESLDNDIFAHVVGRVEFFNGMPQVKISGVTPLTPGEIAGMDISEFLPPSPYDGRGAYGELMSLADREFTYAPWKNLVKGFFGEEGNATLFMNASAATAMHHAGAGGLAVHTLGVFRACQAEADLYPDIDRQILLAGALFHDIGKMREMRSTAFETTYTPEGNLMGHLTLGVLMLEPYCRKAGLPDPLREHFFHLILSHHGHIEYGAVKPPQSREALALFAADYLDSHMNMMDSHLKEIPTGQCAFVRGLEAGLYHPERTPGTDSEPESTDQNDDPGARGSEESADFRVTPASAAVKSSGDAGVTDEGAGPVDIPDDWVECPPEEVPFDEALPEDFVTEQAMSPECHTREVKEEKFPVPEKPARETAGECGRKKTHRHARVEQCSLLNFGGDK